jgi:hypothetical protein
MKLRTGLSSAALQDEDRRLRNLIAEGTANEGAVCSFGAPYPLCDDGRASRAIDELGNEYLPSLLQIGHVVGKAGEVESISNVLAPHAPTKFMVVFPDINSQAHTLVRLRINLALRANIEERNVVADFQSLPILR